MRRNDIRNIAIIAHVDHGKTTLVDCLLRQSGEFRASQLVGECILDSNELERERGITILAKNIAMHYKGVKINLIDTPGHADFGGEVERVLRMADGALVLVDAAEGPMPQTRFVLSKALECGLQPIVVINKIDRPDARPDEVLNETFELFLELGADDELADFPYIFASGRDGYATHDPAKPGDSMHPLLDLVLEHVPGPEIDADAPLQMLVTTLDWSDYVGRIAIGRIQSGTHPPRRASGPDAGRRSDRSTAKVTTVLSVRQARPHGSRRGRPPATSSPWSAWRMSKSATRSAMPKIRRALPRLDVDEPTLQMMFCVNTSPLAGRSGQISSPRRHLRDRLTRELERNVALRVEPIEGTESVRRLRPRAVASWRADRNDAPRRIRTVDRQAAGHHARRSTASPKSRSRRWWSKCRTTRWAPSWNWSAAGAATCSKCTTAANSRICCSRFRPAG